MAVQKILMLVGDHIEDYEVRVPFQTLLTVGHAVYAVCPGKKSGETVHTAIRGFEGDRTYSEKRGHNFALNATFDEKAPASYDARGIPGGRAPEYTRLNPRVLKIAGHFASAHKPIGAVCHGAQPLATAGELEEKTCSCYPAVALDVERAGGRYAAIPIDQAHADGVLVTAPAWPPIPLGSWRLWEPVSSREILRPANSNDPLSALPAGPDA